jgi:hypothetical protein
MPTELPPHLDRDTVEQYARESETMLEFTREARIGRNDARQLLHQLEIEADFDRPADRLAWKSSE